MSEPREITPFKGTVFCLALAALVGAVFYAAMYGDKITNQPTSSAQISIHACETALVFMEPEADPNHDPLATEYDIKKTMDKSEDSLILRSIRQECAESADRLALVKSHLTEARLARMLEGTDMAIKMLYREAKWGVPVTKTWSVPKEKIVPAESKTPNPAGEICGDAIDNNQNGSIDEGCNCVPWKMRNCDDHRMQYCGDGAWWSDCMPDATAMFCDQKQDWPIHLFQVKICGLYGVRYQEFLNQW